MWRAAASKARSAFSGGRRRRSISFPKRSARRGGLRGGPVRTILQPAADVFRGFRHKRGWKPERGAPQRRARVRSTLKECGRVKKGADRDRDGRLVVFDGGGRDPARARLGR